MKPLFRHLLLILTCAFFLFWMGMDSELFARAGGGRSSGSRGYSSGRSYQQSPSPAPAPAPQQRNYQQPTQTLPAGAGRGFFSGLAGGLVGGMLGGMLFRSLGLAGGSDWGSGEFGFGDILLILILLGVIYFVVKKFRSQRAMQMSTAGTGVSPLSYTGSPAEPAYIPSAVEEIPETTGPAALRYIKEMDPSFHENHFKDLAEDIFFKIQAVWTKRDLSSIRHLLTPEMLNLFQEDVNRLRAAKQMNRLENIAVREVSILDAGQNRGEEFITVKFQANLLDYVEDEASHRVISGSTSEPVKFIEFWTFSRNVGEPNWVLAGITQEGDR